MNHHTPNVLILGGYGTAGKAIAMLLGKRFHGSVRLAGRSSEKAESLAEQLNQQWGAKCRFTGEFFDVDDELAIAQCARGQDMIVVSCEVSPSVIENLIRSCVTAGADYVDITPNTKKKAVFQRLKCVIAAGTSRFVLDAGADPGLPGWLIQWLARESPEHLTDIVAFGRYRSDAIGYGGAGDILGATDSQGWVYNGSWRRSKPWDARLKKYQGGLGRALSVPIRLDEFDELPVKLGLDTLKFYHAGLNPVTDCLMLLESSGIARVMPLKFRLKLFFEALKRFTSKPYGLSLEAEGKGAKHAFRAAIGHTDLYHATAIPAVLMCEFLSTNPDIPAGYGYLGYWANQYPTFLEELQKAGFWFDSASPDPCSF